MAGVFHGWKLVGALTAVLFFAAGGSVYVFPVFIASFQEEFGWSMAQVSVGAAIFAIVMGLCNPLVGALFARFGARRTMLTAATLLALTALGYTFLVDLWMLYAILLVAGFAVAGWVFDETGSYEWVLVACTIGLLLSALLTLLIRPARHHRQFVTEE